MNGSFKLDFDSFVEKFENDLDCIYMETGSNYDIERETFEETQYADYMVNRGYWSNSS